MGFLADLLDTNKKVLKKMQVRLDRINALEPSISALTDEELKAKTEEFKNRIKTEMGDAPFMVGTPGERDYKFSPELTKA